METPKTKQCPHCPHEMIRHNFEYNCQCGHCEIIPDQNEYKSSFDFEMWKPILSMLTRDHLINLIKQLIGYVDQAAKQRDEWKANHDNQVKLKQIILDRPDLRERAALVQKLIEELRVCHDDNESLHIRVSKLEEIIRHNDPENPLLPENLDN